MRLLIALTYYRPHVSGVTVYAERLARGLARNGHEVTVLTSRYSPGLSARERIDGVNVVRVPIWWKVSKGVIMPAFPFYAAAYIRHCDSLNIHMPQFEASVLAVLGRMFGKRVVATYHCDLKLPDGFFNRFVEASLVPLNETAARLADQIVCNSADYAVSSSFLSRHAAKLRPVAPPIDIAVPDADATHDLKAKWKLYDNVCIGFAARFAAEKGVEFLLEAMPRIHEVYPNARVVFTGAYKDVIGEDDYWRRLQPLLDRDREHLTFFDLLPAEQMPNFFALCDVLAVTSLNSTESFGLVQVEAMLSGTPVVSSDLPGIREAVRRTGMGRLVPPCDPAALADAILDVLANRDRYLKPRSEIVAAFDLDRTLREYEEILRPAL